MRVWVSIGLSEQHISEQIIDHPQIFPGGQGQFVLLDCLLELPYFNIGHSQIRVAAAFFGSSSIASSQGPAASTHSCLP